jgi:hypothetical protein
MGLNGSATFFFFFFFFVEVIMLTKILNALIFEIFCHH